MTLIERSKKFLDEMEIPMTVFARKVSLSPQAIYSWRSGKLILSDAALKRIDDYLTKYGF